MKAFKGTFTAAVATGAQVVSGIVDETGSAFTPKALLIWSSYGTTTGFLDGFALSIGVTDGTTSGCAFTIMQDNVAGARRESNQTTDLINICSATATTALRRATFTSFASGQFTINWAVQDGVAAIFHYIALGGADLTPVVKSETSCFPTTAPAVGSNPAAVLAHTCRPISGNTLAFAWWALATATGIIPQALSSLAGTDASNPTACRKRQRTDRQSSEIGANSLTDNFLFGLTPFGPLVDIGGTGSGAITNLLSLAGIAAFGNSGNARTTNGTTAVTGCGFAPKLVILMFWGDAANTGLSNDMSFCMGAADRTRQGYAYAGAPNGVATSVGVTKESTTAVIQSATPNATAGSSTVTSEAAIASLDADGFTLNFTTTDATARQYVWLALGDAAAAGGGGAASHTWFGGFG